jgi:hypothetical protein
MAKGFFYLNKLTSLSKYASSHWIDESSAFKSISTDTLGDNIYALISPRYGHI